MKHRSGYERALIVLFAGVVAGCGSAKSNLETSAAVAGFPVKETPAVDSPAPEQKRVSNRPSNDKGRVFIVEYHHVRVGKGTMFRTPEEFRSDLERLYKDGFRPATVSDYLSDDFKIAPGASPVVFTFDDANPSQIRLLPNGRLDPACALGIWSDFARQHPDFPIRATFYVLPTMWGQPNFVDDKVKLVRSLGCELADHTITHPILRKLSDDRVKWEIGEAALRLRKLHEPEPYSFAFPYGVSPKNKALVHGFDYKGSHIPIKAALLVGAEPAPSTKDPKFNAYRVPRIQACAGPAGIDYWLDQFEHHEVKVYVK